MQCGAHAHGTRQHGEGCGHVFDWSQAPRYQASMAMAEEKRQPPGFSAILAWVMQQLDRHFESFVGFIVHLNMCKWKMTFHSDPFPFRKICLILLFFLILRYVFVFSCIQAGHIHQLQTDIL